MLSLITESLNAYDLYKGGRSFIILSFVAILFIYLVEDKKEIKQVLAYLPTAILGLFLFPVFSFVANRYFLEGGVYYRVLWLIPFSLITAYAFVRVIAHLDMYKKRAVIAGLFTVIIIQSGSLIYLNPLMGPAENKYHLPDYVVEAADIMHVEGRDVKAVVPGEMLQFIRQYDPSINLAYGREVLVEGWGDNPLYATMERPYIKTYELTDTAKSQGVEYIILRAGAVTVGTLPIDQLEFSHLARIEGYDIFIFDRADFAEEKKEVYLPLLPEDIEINYVPGATGADSEYR